MKTVKKKQDQQFEWNTHIPRVSNQAMLRVVSCIQLASKYCAYSSVCPILLLNVMIFKNRWGFFSKFIFPSNFYANITKISNIFQIFLNNTISLNQPTLYQNFPVDCNMTSKFLFLVSKKIVFADCAAERGSHIFIQAWTKLHDRQRFSIRNSGIQVPRLWRKLHITKGYSWWRQLNRYPLVTNLCPYCDPLVTYLRPTYDPLAALLLLLVTVYTWSFRKLRDILLNVKWNSLESCTKFS